jgi:hypothetical protein
VVYNDDIVIYLRGCEVKNMCSATFLASNGTYSSADELRSTHLTIICVLINILISLVIILDRYDYISVFIPELALTMGYVPSSGFWADISALWSIYMT